MSWLKVEISTPNKTEILEMADLLETSKNEIFGAVFRFWAWLDENCEDGKAKISEKNLDEIVGLPGFANALCQVQWLEKTGDPRLFNVPNFERHQSKNGKRRALETRRQKKFRERREPVTQASRSDRDKSVTREEKRREEKKKKTTKEKTEAPFSCSLVFSLWAEILPTLPKPNKATATRQAAIRRRLDDGVCFEKLFRRIAASPFLLGESRQGFRATFDWALEPRNVEKILDGNFDHKESPDGSPDYSKPWGATT